MNTVITITRPIIRGSLKGLRLPLTAIEGVTRNVNTNWTPAMAYESFEADTKRILGSLVGDHELVREGNFQKAKIEELVDADRLETKALQRRQEANATLQSRQDSAARGRVRVEKQARQRSEKINQEKVAKQAAARKTTQRRKESVAKTTQARKKSVSVQARTADRTRISQQSAASGRTKASTEIRQRGTSSQGCSQDQEGTA